MQSENVLSADNQQGRIQEKLASDYVSGFVDGEGSFHIAIYKDPRMKTGLKIIPEFHVSQRESSASVLYRFVDCFECGYVKLNHRTNPKDVTKVFVVRDRNDLLAKIIPFFRMHRLQTEKAQDFERFAQIVELMHNGKHRTMDGIQNILSIAYQMNGGGRYRRQKILV